MENLKHYNIMTSCDDMLAPYLSIELTAMACNLKDAVVDFYLFHSRISRKTIEMLSSLCNMLKEGGSIRFHEIKVPNPEKYDELAKHGGGWSGEAYYSLCAHQLLPEDVDRILYIDAGDVLILDDIESYYTFDFQGKSLVATSIRYKMRDGEVVPYDETDLGNREAGLPGILRGIFNSGSYVMNLGKMRQDGRALGDYQYLAERLCEIYGAENTQIYYGDQGLLSAAFAGDICYYGYPQIPTIWFMPFNFCLWYYNSKNEKPEYRPIVAHFAGTAFKPWNGRYPVFIKRFQRSENLRSLDELKLGQAEYFYLWHEYAMMTDSLLEKMGYECTLEPLCQ